MNKCVFVACNKYDTLPLYGYVLYRYAGDVVIKFQTTGLKHYDR